MASISERLGLGNDVRGLKLGQSFTKNGGAAFHSFRYDFKPASVDTTKGNVEIGEGNQVTVTLPHLESTAQTVFRGSKKPCQKECVLIIDHTTGEITLEKLNCNVQLKKTRAEGSSKIQQQVRPITPIDSRKSSPSGHKLSPTWLGAKGGNTASPGNPSNKNSSHWSGTSSSPAAPNQTSPSMPNIFNSNNNNSSSSNNNNSSSRNSTTASINASKSGGGTPPSQPAPHSAAAGFGPDIGILTDSSSSNDDSSSDGSDSEMENEPRAASQTNTVGNDSKPKFPTMPPSMPSIKPSMPSIQQSMPSIQQSMPSMTKYKSLLSEDLQLSESGSDCDD